MNPAEAQFLEERRSYLGGSDAAAVFGVSPWSTPLDIYLRKRGEMPATGREADPAKERILKRGKRLEPIVRDMAAEEWDLKITKFSRPDAQNRYTDPQHEFLAAEIDFEWRVTPQLADELNLPDELIGTIQNGEIKTSHPFAAAKYGEEETDEVPIEYAAQAMHGMMVTNRQVCLFAVLVGSDNLLRYVVRRDDETINAMRVKEVTFWRDHVLKGIPPEPVNLPDVYHLFKRDTGTKIEASAETLMMIDELKAAKAALKTNAERIDDLQFRIGCAMLGPEVMEAKDKPGKHILVSGGKELLTVRLNTQTRIDNDALRLKYPAAALECSKQSVFWSMNLSRRKQ